MVSPPILRYLFALLEPVTACAFFRFLALSYMRSRRSPSKAIAIPKKWERSRTAEKRGNNSF